MAQKQKLPGLTPPLSDEFYIALGRVTAHFAVLEAQIEFLTWSLIGRDQGLGQIVTAQVSFRGLLDLLSSIFRHRVADEALRAELDAVLRRAEAVERRRNLVTHSEWGMGSTPETRTRIKMTARQGKGLKHEFEPMTHAEIELISIEAGDVALALQQFSGKLPADLVGRVEITI
jgi:hypothetical protein